MPLGDLLSALEIILDPRRGVVFMRLRARLSLHFVASERGPIDVRRFPPARGRIDPPIFTTSLSLRLNLFTFFFSFHLNRMRSFVGLILVPLYEGKKRRILRSKSRHCNFFKERSNRLD